jgi:capsular exopolysaccharide synthesis family protein
MLVTSAGSQEGKTITACNLALTLARSGRRVIIIDGDLRRPRVAGYLGLPSGIGLTSVLVGSARLSEATQAWADNLFAVLACGPIPPNPAEMLGSQRMRELLARLREQYDDVILDAAPVLPVADAAVAATGCDGVIMVARHGKTRRDQLQQAVATMRATQTPILGVVLNRVPNRGKTRQYYYAPRVDTRSAAPRKERFVTREATSR